MAGDATGPSADEARNRGKTDAEAGAVRARRAGQYARCTITARQDRAGPGVEGVVDMALTNGLAAIVTAVWPGRETEKVHGRTRVRSAAGLLGVIEAVARDKDDPRARIAEHDEGTYGDGDGLVVLLIPDALEDGPEDAPEVGAGLDGGADEVVPDGPRRAIWLTAPPVELPSPNTEVRVDVLKAAINATAAIRHARDDVDEDGAAAATLTAEHLDALERLDWHFALGALGGEMLDRDETTAMAEESTEFGRASDYLSLLDEQLFEGGGTELERRTAACGDLGQDCPVCGVSALVDTGGQDDRLGEITIGRCVVCSYERTAGSAGFEALGEQISRAANKDD